MSTGVGWFRSGALGHGGSKDSVAGILFGRLERKTTWRELSKQHGGQ